MALRWFWFGLATSLAFLVSNQLFRIGLHPAAAAALSALVGTSVALLMLRWLTVEPHRESRPAAPLPAPTRLRIDHTPAVGLGLAGTAAWVPAPASQRPAAHQPLGLPRSTSPEPAALLDDLMPLGFHGAVEEFKRQLLNAAIHGCQGNRAEAARRLGLQRTYLYRLTRQLGGSRSDSERRPAA